MPMISFAQNFEDVLLARAFRGKRAGFYVDVGAMHPFIHSVTQHFHDLGWRGVNIEPRPDLFRLFLDHRRRDINIDCAVGETQGTAGLFVVSDLALGTTVAEQAAALERDHGLKAQKVTVTMRTLADICDEHAPAEIDFLKIDVEGAERAVVAGADFRRHRPAIVLVEATRPLTQIPSHAEWEPILLAAGYGFAKFDGLNRWYVADERAALAQALQLPPNVFDDFEPQAVAALRQEVAELRRAKQALEQQLAAMRQAGG